jgi:lipopolysaccharide export system permease protein
MLTLFDRYLIQRYLHVFGISFTALFGLFVIFHAFTNSDEFFDGAGDRGTTAILKDMAIFYLYRISQFFDMLGGTVAVIAAMVAFSLVLRNGELNPILSAGINSYRLVRPIMIGTVFVNSFLVINQEFIIPEIATELQLEPGRHRRVTEDVEPVYDFASQILVSGQRLDLKEQRIEDAEFVLPAGKVTHELTSLKSTQAEFVRAAKDGRNGWLLKGVKTPFEKLRLTDEGQNYVLRGDSPDELFVATDVSFDRVYKKDKNFGFLSTRELVRRLRNPSFSDVSIMKQSLFLHTRITQPILNILVVLVGVPLVCRKESRSLIANLAYCAAAMGVVFGIGQAFQYAGAARLIPVDLAAWGPVLIAGGLAAWFSGSMRT